MHEVGRLNSQGACLAHVYLEKMKCGKSCFMFVSCTQLMSATWGKNNDYWMDVQKRRDAFICTNKAWLIYSADSQVM